MHSVDGRVQHQSALAGRKRRHVGAAAAKLIRRGARARMFIGESLRSLTVDFRAVSQNPTAGRADEVRISEYAGRIMRNWYVVLIAVVAAVLLVVLNTVARASSHRARPPSISARRSRRSVDSTISNTLAANPTTAQAYLRTSAVVDKAASDSGIKSGSVLKKPHQRHGAAASSDRQDDRRQPQHPDHGARPVGQEDGRGRRSSRLADSLIAWSRHNTSSPRSSFWTNRSPSTRRRSRRFRRWSTRLRSRSTRWRTSR